MAKFMLAVKLKRRQVVDRKQVKSLPGDLYHEDGAAGAAGGLLPLLHDV